MESINRQEIFVPVNGITLTDSEYLLPVSGINEQTVNI